MFYQGINHMIDLTICVFDIIEHSLFLYDILTVMKHICSSTSDHTDNSAFTK